MADHFLARELFTDSAILARIVGRQRGLAADMFAGDRAKRRATQVGEGERPGAAIALNQPEGNLFAYRADVLGVSLGEALVAVPSARKGFAALHDIALAAERSGEFGEAEHRGADAMRQEPRRVVGLDVHRTLKLKAGYALLR
jgi:hypothetical protein